LDEGLMGIDLHRVLTHCQKAILVEAGGGGDLISAFSIYRLLEVCKIQCFLGGFAWERFVFDPLPGPRSPWELLNITALSENLALANQLSTTLAGVRLTEAIVAEYIGADVLLFFLCGASRQLAEGIREALDLADADLVIFVDGGGDSLAVGTEPGLVSPLADSVSLSAARRLAKETTVLWAVTGLACDGELTLLELEGRISALAAAGGLLGSWGLTETAVQDLRALSRTKRSDVTALIIESAEGRVGPRLLRQGTRRGETSYLGSLTLFFDPAVVFRQSPLAKAVYRTSSIDSSNRALHRLGVTTELDLERSAAAKGALTYHGLLKG
jgi:hypothetical protein